MNKLVMNYLVTEGFKDAAERFQEEAGITAGQNLGELDNRIRIRDNIQVPAPCTLHLAPAPFQAGRIQESISMVNEQHPTLLDSDRYLLFHLQQQHLIELIREQVQTNYYQLQTINY